MRFGHDTIVALQAGVVIANSAFPPDTLTTVADLDALFERHGYTGRHDRTADELAAVRDLRPQLITLFSANRDAAAALANEMLADGRCAPAARSPRRLRLAHPRRAGRRSARHPHRGRGQRWR